MSEHVDVADRRRRACPGSAPRYHLQTECPGKTYAILEARDASAAPGTCSAIPGVRSDSDMYTLGYSFRPWTQAKAIADGASILALRPRHRGGVRHRPNRSASTTGSCGAAGRPRRARWTVERVDRQPRPVRRLTQPASCSCAAATTATTRATRRSFRASSDFEGRIVHPQHWPDDLDYAGKRVVVIGSGATAVTLVPALAQTAAHVTMLQRSPSYILSLPAEDPIANRLRALLGTRAARTP